MQRLQDIKIQTKLVGVFAVVFAAGLVALIWNAVTIYQSKQNVDRVVLDSRDTVTEMLDLSDQLIYLQILQLEFRELEGIEKDYVLAGDPGDPEGLVAQYDEWLGYLREDLNKASETATDDRVRQVMGSLQAELDYQGQFFAELVDLMQTNPQAAQVRSLEGTGRKADNIYNVLADLVNEEWEITYASVDRTRAQMDMAVEETDTQMQRAFNVTLVTAALFVLAGVVVGAAVFIVSRQIVQPVMIMADVAEAIEKEKEDFKPDQLTAMAHRQDEIGQLARVFERMAREVSARIERLKQQVAQLQIVIDHDKVAAQVSEITDSDYFQSLQSKARSLRRRTPSKGETPGTSAG